MTLEERRPLAGRRVVVTRARDQARALRERLEAQGAEVIEFPTIRLMPPADYGPLDRAIDRLDTYGWIVFTSQNGVRAFVDRMRAAGRAAARLPAVRVAAIGPGTAQALRAQGLRVDLAPGEFRAEALLRAFARHDLRGARVLVPRAETARRLLPDGLRRLGAAVDVVPVYRTEIERAHAPDSRRRVLCGEADAVTFTSSSTVRNFMDLLGEDAVRVLCGSLVACIGPVTAATVREYGVNVGLVAGTYTIAGLVAALVAALGRPGPGSRDAGDRVPGREGA